MKCPVCLTPDLLMTVRQGVEIDYCPTCRGIWLDRGELDKLMRQMQDDRWEARNDREYDSDDEDPEKRWGRRQPSSDDHRKYNDPRRKKKSLFDIFDFD
jgi:uncharacterized protein